MDDLTREQVIEYSRRLEEFLKDEAIVYALSGLKRNYFEAFQKPNQPEAALSLLYGKVRALSDLQNALQAVIDAGTIAKAQLKAAEDKEKREAEARQRSRR